MMVVKSFFKLDVSGKSHFKKMIRNCLTFLTVTSLWVWRADSILIRTELNNAFIFSTLEQINSIPVCIGTGIMSALHNNS